MEIYKPLELVRKNHMLSFIETQTARIGIKNPIRVSENEDVVIENFFEGLAFDTNSGSRFATLQPVYDKFLNRYKGDWNKTRFNLTTYVIAECIENLWINNKQALLVDEDFMKCLCKTKSNLKIPYDLPLYLPFTTFVLDLQNQTFFKDTEYCFVHIQKRIYGDGFLMSIVRVVKDNIFTVYSKEFDNVKVETYKNKDGELIDDVDKKYIEYGITDDAIVPFDREIKIEEYLSKKEYERLKEIKASNSQIELLFYFCIQLCMYMYANKENTDIVESQDTIHTFNKHKKKVENTYDELRKWEIGTVVGTFIRENEKNVASGSKTSSRKSPHYRVAHWHNYWQGNKKDGYRLIPHFVSGCFINGTSDDVGVKIRKIK